MIWSASVPWARKISARCVSPSIQERPCWFTLVFFGIVQRMLHVLRKRPGVGYVAKPCGTLTGMSSIDRAVFTDLTLSYLSVIECGHSFCLLCLQNSIGDTPKFEVVKEDIVRNLRDVLRTVRLDSTVSLERDIVPLIHPSKFVKPLSFCPICRTAVYYSPVKNYSMRAVMDTISQLKSSIENRKGSDTPQQRESTVRTKTDEPLATFLQQSIFSVD